MKKIILSVLALALAITASQAQELAIGVKGGANFANLHGGSAGAVYKNRTGYNLGAFALIKISKIGIQPEVLFSKQGSNYNVSTTTFKNDFSYVNVPILLKLYTIAGINIQVGPQFGFLTSATSKFTDASGTTTTNVKKDLKSSDFSAALGLGWDLPFGLSVDARYNLGLSKVSSNSFGGSGSDAPKNQVFQVSVGFKLIKLGS